MFSSIAVVTRLANNSDTLNLHLKTPAATCHATPSIHLCVAVDTTASSAETAASINSIRQLLPSSVTLSVVVTDSEAINQQLSEISSCSNIKDTRIVSPTTSTTLGSLSKSIDILNSPSNLQQVPVILLLSNSSHHETDLLPSVREHLESTASESFIDSLTIHAISVSSSVDVDSLMSTVTAFGGFLAHADTSSQVLSTLSRVVSSIINTLAFRVNVKVTSASALPSVQQPLAAFTDCKVSGNSMSLQIGSIQQNSSRDIPIRIDASESVRIELNYITFTGKQAEQIQVETSQLQESTNESNINRIFLIDYLISNTRKFEFGIPSYATSGVAHLLTKLSATCDASWIEFVRFVQTLFENKDSFLKAKPLLLSVLRSHSLQQQIQEHSSLALYELDRVKQLITQAYHNQSSEEKEQQQQSNNKVLVTEQIIKPQEYYDIYDHQIY